MLNKQAKDKETKVGEIDIDTGSGSMSYNRFEMHCPFKL